MDLRRALIEQGPSLELLRSAANEIARLDAKVRDSNDELEGSRALRELDREEIYRLKDKVDRLENELNEARNVGKN